MLEMISTVCDRRDRGQVADLHVRYWMNRGDLQIGGRPKLELAAAGGLRADEGVGIEIHVNERQAQGNGHQARSGDRKGSSAGSR